MTVPARWLAAALAVPALACSAGGAGASQARFAGHRATMASLGFQPVGSPIEAPLAQGESRRHTLSLDGGECYRVVALGGSDDLALELALQRPEGVRRALSEGEGREASLRVCPTETGAVELVVTARAGAGRYAVSVWEDGSADEGGEQRRGTCEAPHRLEFGQTVEGTLVGARDNTSGSCLQGRGPDVIYALEVPARRRVTLRARTDFAAALYLQRECGAVTAEISCGTAARAGEETRLDTVLSPGTYFVVVDRAGRGAQGRFTLGAEIGEAPELTQGCAQLPALPLGRPVRGDTAGRTDLMHGSCSAEHFAGPEQAWQLSLEAPARVRASLSAEGEWNTGLYIRQQCAREESEVACNDDAENRQHARITRTLEAGQYTVVVDGYAAGAQGPYSLLVESAPLEGGGIANDTCATAQPLPLDGTAAGDTFPARDDLSGSCGGEGAPDAVYRLEVPRRAHLRASLARTGLGEHPDTARLYLTRTCGQRRAEVACGHGQVDAVVTPGTWYLVVDGASGEHFGQYVVRTAATDPSGIESACRDVPRLVPGTTVRGSTAGADRLHASCGNRARSPEQVYALQLSERSRVALQVEAQFDSVLSLRRACERESSEIACNDDDHSPRTSRIEAVLEPGTYYAVVDGFDQGNAGEFTITATVASLELPADDRPPTAPTTDH